MSTKPQITKAAAIDWAGSTRELAQRLGISSSAVSQWDEQIPEGRCWQLMALGCPAVPEPQAVETTV